jgi:hypothetical protein
MDGTSWAASPLASRDDLAGIDVPRLLTRDQTLFGAPYRAPYEPPPSKGRKPCHRPARSVVSKRS